MILRSHHLRLTFRVVSQHDLEWTHHGHAAFRIVIEIFADSILKHAHFNQVLFLGHSNTADEIS